MKQMYEIIVLLYEINEWTCRFSICSDFKNLIESSGLHTLFNQ